MKSQSSHRVHWSDLPAIVLFVALGGIVLLQFLSRYVFNDSVAWTEEIARYLLIGVAYFGSLTALRRGGHIFLEVIYRRTTDANVKALALLTDVAVVVFHLVLSVLAVSLAFVADRRMISVDLPKSIVYGVVAVALVMATIVAIRRFVQRVRMEPADIRRAIEEAASGERVE
jgi:TRAP-type C4-dicarboxylate transport system permease small subunit